ncbi:MAG: hypothetical protein JXB85_11220 [Anaerolineales bacterium]|nr:hypothetical protein [Anaerolineales bacterium]
MNAVIAWLRDSPEPWTRYRTLVDLLGRPESDLERLAARREMITHPRVGGLVATAGEWEQRLLKRHNDAGHPLYALSTLADFGLKSDDPGMAAVIEKVMAHQAPDGPFQTLSNYPAAFGGSGRDEWLWIACDAPTLLYAMLAFGLGNDRRVRQAAAHLPGQVSENGYRCAAAAELGRFRGPGRKDDPCPIANVYALKALARLPGQAAARAAEQAAEMLLTHWEQRREKKYYLFGAGTDFQRLKYPFVWYDLLHVVDVLSRCAFVHADARFKEMLSAVTAQADADGRYTAGSMYMAWKGWSFADKKVPSPWLTCLVLRILRRVEAG